MNRRKFFGLPLLLPASAVGVAGAAIAKSGREVPMRGETDNGGNWWMMTCDIKGIPGMSDMRFESARMVEVELNGKREYVMTFERMKKS